MRAGMSTAFAGAAKKIGAILKRLLLMLAALACTPSAARAEWFEAASTHFRVVSEGSAESVRAYATRLERFDKGMRVLNGLPDEDLGPANRVTVYVVDGVGDVRRLARGAANVAGFYIARAEGSVAITPRRAGDGSRFDIDAETILLHEYAHHFMIQNWIAIFPAWFVEGFAEFNSTARFDRDGGVTFGAPAEHRAYGLTMVDALPIEALLGSSERRLTDEQMEATIYGRGWLLTHYLTFEPKRAGQLGAYLTALKRGTPNMEAARAAFGDLHALDRELTGYLHRPRMSALRIGPERLPIAPVSVRPLTPGEAAILALRIQSDRGVNEKEGKALAPRMRQAAAPFPNDPEVQASLAEAEFDAGNLVEADAAADRALAAKPNDMHALTYKGRIALAVAQADAHAGAAVWKEARRRMLAANRVDPNAPEPFILFYDSFAAEGVAPTRNAVNGLLRAFELAPQDRDLRVKVARQHLTDGKAAEARAALTPLAYDPHGGTFAETIRAVIVKLDEGGPQAALAVWQGLIDKAKAEEGKRD
jgi:Flp pilus assembly protein TadD